MVLAMENYRNSLEGSLEGYAHDCSQPVTVEFSWYFLVIQFYFLFLWRMDFFGLNRVAVTWYFFKKKDTKSKMIRTTLRELINMMVVMYRYTGIPPGTPVCTSEWWSLLTYRTGSMMHDGNEDTGTCCTSFNTVTSTQIPSRPFAFVFLHILVCVVTSWVLCSNTLDRFIEY